MLREIVERFVAAGEQVEMVCTELGRALAQVEGNVRGSPVILAVGALQRSGALKPGIVADLVKSADAIKAEITGVTMTAPAVETPAEPASPASPPPAASVPPTALVPPPAPPLPPPVAAPLPPGEVPVVTSPAKRRGRPKAAEALSTAPAPTAPAPTVPAPTGGEGPADEEEDDDRPLTGDLPSGVTAATAAALVTSGRPRRMMSGVQRDHYAVYSCWGTPVYASAAEYAEKAPTALVPLKLLFQRPFLGVARFLARPEGQCKHTLPDLLLLAASFRIAPNALRRGLRRVLRGSMDGKDGVGGWVLRGQSIPGSDLSLLGIYPAEGRIILPGDDVF